MSNMDNDSFEKLLEGALKRQAETSRGDEAAADRVLNRLSGPLPRQDVSRWRWPTVLLDWQFAPAWPRVAALACCAALGFMIGIAGLDRRIDRADAAFTVANRDFGSIVFEPEPLTGA